MSRWLLLVAVVVLGIVGWWSLTRLPRAALERVIPETLECSRELSRTGEGDPEQCRQSDPMLVLARFLLWTRSEARYRNHEMETIVAELRLEVASIRDLDPAARDRAARDWILLDRSPRSKAHGPYHALRHAYRAGALEVVAEWTRVGDYEAIDDFAMRAALIVGDRSALARFISSPAPLQSAAIDAAIIACLLGDKDLAAEHLHAAQLAARESHEPFQYVGHLVALHCELPDAIRMASMAAAELPEAFRSFSPDAQLDIVDQLVLGARAVPPDRREAWLDHASMSVWLDPLAWIRLRIATAERLGDPDASARWRERESALLELVPDDRTAALFHLFDQAR